MSGTEVMIPGRCLPIDDLDGPLYPDTFRPPALILRVEILSNGSVVVRVIDGGIVNAHLLTPRFADIGALRRC